MFFDFLEQKRAPGEEALKIVADLRNLSNQISSIEDSLNSLSYDKQIPKCKDLMKEFFCYKQILSGYKGFPNEPYDNHEKKKEAIRFRKLKNGLLTLIKEINKS